MCKHADMNLRAVNLNTITRSHYESNTHCYLNVLLKFVTVNRDDFPRELSAIQRRAVVRF
jgi:hypothetical protein